LADAAIVTRLRGLDLPLEQVREVLHGRDTELTGRILAAHHTTMEKRLAETERIVAELQSGLAPVTHTPVHVRVEPARDTVRVLGEVTEDDFGTWLGWAFARLTVVLRQQGAAPAGPPGALYRPEIPDEGPEPVEAFLPIDGPVRIPPGERSVAVGEVPEARVAVLVHAGDYDSIGDTYRTLGAWVARHASHAGERVREWYVVGPADAASPEAYRTELAWPIRSTDTTDPTKGREP
jgi:effector-binding domain-containing protein